MADSQTISLKNDSILERKKKLNLSLNLLISALGISSLFIKFFLVDGLLAFRAFTVDGNIFTTIVSVIAVVVNIRELIKKTESGSRTMFFLELASAVTEAVIFIVVMIGYLPVFTDNPKITPYHMFCLHVAIPVLAVVRFIFFEKPLGILKPFKLLIGAIPIGVYGIGVVTAIKLGILPVSLVPYSFLDFDSNFLWYFFFALFAIPCFGFLWSWTFYRLNIRTSHLWYSKEDLERLKKDRIRSLSNFDSVNSAILIIYCGLAVLLLMFSFMGMSTTGTRIQGELMQYIGYYYLDGYSDALGDGIWHVKDGALYKGDIFIGDGTEESANKEVMSDELMEYDCTFYLPANMLSPQLSEKYAPIDYVSVNHSTGNYSQITPCGETLDRALVSAVFDNEVGVYYENIKIDKQGYYHLCMSFGETMLEGNDVGIVEMFFPAGELTAQTKKAEYNQDILVVTVVTVIFAILYLITSRWIRTLEYSVDFLRKISSGITPEDIHMGKTPRLSGLERQLNILREINLDRTTAWDKDREE